MVQFVRNTINFFTMEVIEANFLELMKKYDESENFDKIIEYHN